MQKSPKKKADLKIVILGESSVGKTSLIQRYIERVFNEDHLCTIGASFFLKQWGPYNVAIWDTAGEEKYSGLSSFYCRGAAAAIIAYDITKGQSFNVLQNRHLHLLQTAEPNCLVVIVGTKLDLVTNQNRGVSKETAQELAKKQNENKERSLESLTQLPFFETSAKTGQNVDKMFEFILENCLPLNDSNTAKQYLRTSSGIELGASKANNSGGKCCS